MRKIIFLTASFYILTLLSPLYTKAHDEPTALNAKLSGTPSKQNAGRQATIAKEKFEDRKASIEAKTEETRKAKVQNFWQNSKKVILAMINRIEILISRIETRVDKVASDDSGKDLSKIKTDIQKAKTLIADAKTKVENIDNTLEDSLENGSTKTAFRSHISNISAIRKDLKEAHKILVQILGELKGLRVGTTKLTNTATVQVSPTSSPTVQPTLTLTVTPTP